MSSKKNIIGLMSGTSCDGLDLVCCSFENISGRYSYEMIASDFVPYSNSFARSLKEAIHLSSSELIEFHHSYGNYLGEEVLRFISKFKLENIDCIASHGHTVLHRPGKGYTFQIGHGQNIAQKVKSTVVSDFRTQDVILGGQGAPLVPIGDHYLFGDYDACINLGGFSNISLMEDKERVAFDICPFNILMNPIATRLGKDFDENGNFASEGILNHELLEALNEITYYAKPTPKSLALEDVQTVFNPVIQAFDLSEKDVLRTLLEHYVEQIIQVLPQKAKILLTGGGVKNGCFIALLKNRYIGELIIPDEKIVDFKESIVFAFLGYLRLLDMPNVLASVTGAAKDHSSGCIFHYYS